MKTGQTSFNWPTIRKDQISGEPRLLIIWRALRNRTENSSQTKLMNCPKGVLANETILEARLVLSVAP